MKIVALDPGLTTGICVAHWESGREFTLLQTGVIEWENRFKVIDFVLQSHKPSFIVVESFRLYSHKAREQIGSDFPSAQFIGTLQAYAYEHGLLDNIRLQPANVRSSVRVLDEHKRMVGASPHVNDAYRHLRYFIIVGLPKEHLTESGE